MSYFYISFILLLLYIIYISITLPGPSVCSQDPTSASCRNELTFLILVLQQKTVHCRGEGWGISECRKALYSLTISLCLFSSQPSTNSQWLGSSPLGHLHYGLTYHPADARKRNSRIYSFYSRCPCKLGFRFPLIDFADEGSSTNGIPLML